MESFILDQHRPSCSPNLWPKHWPTRYNIKRIIQDETLSELNNMNKNFLQSTLMLVTKLPTLLPSHSLSRAQSLVLQPRPEHGKSRFHRLVAPTLTGYLNHLLERLARFFNLIILFVGRLKDVSSTSPLQLEESLL